MRDVDRKGRLPSLHLTSPRPPLASIQRLSSGYVSPLTDYRGGAGGDGTGSLPVSPLTGSPLPVLPPLDFTSISDGPLVRDGEVLSAGPWGRSSDDASASAMLLSPGVGAGPPSSAHSGYDEDDDESEDEFADYRPRWRKEEERRRMMTAQQQQQRRSSPGATATRGGDAQAEDVSSNDDYIVPGYNDSHPGAAVSAGVRKETMRRKYPSRAAAAYASRAQHSGHSRAFWGGSSVPLGTRAGAAAASWMVSLRRFFSVAGTWAVRFVAIYLASLLIYRTRNMM